MPKRKLSLIRVSKTAKYSEGYILSEERIVVSFVRDFKCESKQACQQKSLVCVRKTMQ